MAASQSAAEMLQMVPTQRKTCIARSPAQQELHHDLERATEQCARSGLQEDARAAACAPAHTMNTVKKRESRGFLTGHARDGAGEGKWRLGKQGRGGSAWARKQLHLARCEPAALPAGNGKGNCPIFFFTETSRTPPRLSLVSTRSRRSKRLNRTPKPENLHTNSTHFFNPAV